MVSPILPTPCCLWIKEAMLSTMACCAYTEPCCSSEKILGKGNLEETSGNDCIFLAIFKYSIFCGEICHMTYPINHWINYFETLWLCQSSTMWVSRAYPLNQDWIRLASSLLTVDIKKESANSIHVILLDKPRVFVLSSCIQKKAQQLGAQGPRPALCRMKGFCCSWPVCNTDVRTHIGLNNTIYIFSIQYPCIWPCGSCKPPSFHNMAGLHQFKYVQICSSMSHL